MSRRRRDETRWSDRTALVAAAVALPVTGAGAIATVLAGPVDTTAAVTGIVVPGVVAAVTTALAIHFLLIRRQRRRERDANRRLAAAKRELHDERHERTIVRELERALDRCGVVCRPPVARGSVDPLAGGEAAAGCCGGVAKLAQRHQPLAPGGQTAVGGQLGRGLAAFLGVVLRRAMAHVLQLTPYA